MPPRFPTSRAYWNLRAEQVLNRVFNDEDNILRTVQVEVNQPSKQPDASTRNPPRLSWPQVSLVGLGLIAVLGSSGLTLHWKLTQQALEREGNLALIERLRNNQTPETENDQRKRTEKNSSKAPVNGALEEPAIENELRDSALPKTTTLEPITIPLPSENSSRASVAV